MNISRISKAVAEVRGDQKFQAAEDVRNKDVDLLLPPRASDTVVRMAQIAAALALRCFKGKMRIHSDGRAPLLRPALEAEARKMRALERLDFAPSVTGPWQLGLGCQPESAISADVSGWTARLNGTFEERLPAAPPAMTFSVSCAMAKLFNRAIFGADKHAFEAWDFCLLRFASGSASPVVFGEDVNLGRIAMLGAGAIGSAMAYVLSLCAASGHLDIIDFDVFQEPNLETCISADIADVLRPLRKALALSAVFNGGRITAVERRCKVEPDEAILKEQWDAFICAVDNPGTRLILDDVNADVLLNAGLGARKADVGWVLWTQHRNGFRSLSSIYKNGSHDGPAPSTAVPEEFREECSRKSYQGVALALPFAGLTAGSLLAASLYQRTAGALPDIGFMQMDLFGKQERMTRLNENGRPFSVTSPALGATMEPEVGGSNNKEQDIIT